MGSSSSSGAPLQLDCDGQNIKSDGAGWTLGHCFAGIGESTVEDGKSFLNFFPANSKRLNECDKDPEIKKALYFIYNNSVPNLLKLKAPTQDLLQKTSCARVEANLLLASREKARQISSKYDHLLVQTSNDGNTKNQTQADKANIESYLLWKRERIFAAPDDLFSMDFFDQVFSQLGIRQQCLHRLALVALKCDILYQMASLGFMRNPNKASGLVRDMRAILKQRRMLFQKKIETELLNGTGIEITKNVLPDFTDIPVLTANFNGLMGAGGKIPLVAKIIGTSKAPPLGSLVIDGKKYPVQLMTFNIADRSTSGVIVYITDPNGKVVYTAVPTGLEASSIPILEMARKIRETGQLPPLPAP
jgi:hypothetical protein